MFFVLGDFLFVLIAIAAAYRLSRRDFPTQPKQGIAYYFIALILANGFLSWFATNQATVLFGH